MNAKWQKARLIPATSKGSDLEREQRATSVLLAVLSVVRPLSTEILGPLGATKAKAALVEAYAEPAFVDDRRRSVRPDGLLRVTYGSQDPFVAIVEVKTGDNRLDADQVNQYIDVARREKFDVVITISNEIAPVEGQHPTPGLRVRKDSRVSVAHYSWTRIGAMATRIRESSTVDDPEQAWILNELLRYLEDPRSGVLELTDAGPLWSEVKERTRDRSLTRSDPAASDIARRWEQVLTFAALKLGVQTNENVREVLTRAHQHDPALRTRDCIRDLCEHGVLTGSLRVPNTAGDLLITADLRARRLTVSSEIKAPTDRKERGSIAWLIRQLPESTTTPVVESYAFGNARGVAATVAVLRDDPTPVLDELPGDVTRFNVVMRFELGMNRRPGKSLSFIDSILTGISSFYRDVLQHLTPYQPKAPRLQETTESNTDEPAEN